MRTKDGWKEGMEEGYSVGGIESSGSSRDSRFSGCEPPISEAQALLRNLVAIDRAPSGTEEIFHWRQRITA